MEKNNAYSIVYVTNDYEQFTHLDGNRAVEVRRKNRIKESIEKVGYILNPIVVNEDMAVIDGQARLAVFEELNLPVYYVIAEGAGIEECRQLNIGQTNWRTFDYIKSYADGGNMSYKRLLGLVDDYAHEIGSFDAVIMAATNKICKGGGTASIVRGGSFTISAKDVGKVREALEFCEYHAKGINRIDGDKRIRVSAICWVLRNTNINKDRLGMILDERSMDFQPVASNRADRFLKDMSDIYNWHLQPDKCIYLDMEYDRFCRIEKANGRKATNE